MTFNPTAAQWAELETLRTESLEQTQERWRRAREAATRGCPHSTITLRPGALPICNACDAQMLGAIWATPDGDVVIAAGPHSQL